MLSNVTISSWQSCSIGWFRSTDLPSIFPATALFFRLVLMAPAASLIVVPCSTSLIVPSCSVTLIFMILASISRKLLVVNAKKRISPRKGRVRSARGSTLIRPITRIGPHWYPLSGISRCRILPGNLDQWIQRHGYKGVNSQTFTGEAFSLDFSLWTVRIGNHVFDHCLMMLLVHSTQLHPIKSRGKKPEI
ncbi:hypothetical protein D3C76_523810 [compost metagenome]